MNDQLRRALLSIPASIAERQARQHTAEFAQHLAIARGSLAEVDAPLLVAVSLRYLKEYDLDLLTPLLLEVRRLLRGLIHSLQRGRQR